MRSLPLYGGDRRAAVEKASPLDLDPDCRRCALGEREQLVNRCIPDDGEPGGLLIVGEGPGRDEERSNRPFVGQTGAYLRRQVTKHWSGPVAYANATRCRPPHEGKDRLRDRAVTACRGYLRQTLDEVKPKRVIALGGWASLSVLGRAVAPLSVRGGYGWLWNDGRPIPVFLLMHPAAALRNQTYRKWFEADFALAVKRPIPEVPPWLAECRLVETAEDARKAARELMQAEWVSLDVETFGRMHEPGFRVFSVALCAKGSTSPWVWTLTALEDRAAVAQLQLVLDSVDVVGQNIKFDRQALGISDGVEMPSEVVDTRLVRKLIDPDSLADLETMAELVGMGGHKEENAVGVKTAKENLMEWCRRQPEGPRATEALDTVADVMAEAWERAAEVNQTEERRRMREAGEKVPTRRTSMQGKSPPPWWTAPAAWFTEDVRRQLGGYRRLGGDWVRQKTGAPKFFAGVRPEVWAYALVDRDVSARYNALDSLTTAMLAVQQERQMEATPRVRKVWETSVRPASSAIAWVERNGVLMSREAIGAFSAKLALELEDVHARLAPYDFNPDSAPQVRELLFRKLGLPPIDLTDTGLEATDHDALAALRGQHPIVEDLLEYRRLKKLKGTYADGMITHIQGDGRIHTSMNIDGARTGRLSSSDPNLQNAPRAGTEDGKMFRDCFIAPPGYLLVEGDFSQIELRVAAFLSGDPEMIRIFNTPGADIHMTVAKSVSQAVWGVPPDEVTDERRSKVKTFVFGIIYGMTDDGIMSRTGCSLDEAQAIREAVMGSFSRLGQWIREAVRAAYRQGGSYTWWDGDPCYRFRPLPMLGDGDNGRRKHAENASYNGPVQGTANEFGLQSLSALVGWIRRSDFPARTVLTVHDSIMSEVREDRVVEYIDEKRRIMTSWNSAGVPIAVDFKVGKSWGSLEKWKPQEAKAA